MNFEQGMEVRRKGRRGRKGRASKLLLLLSARLRAVRGNGLWVLWVQPGDLK